MEKSKPLRISSPQWTEMLHHGSRGKRSKLKDSGIETLDLDHDQWVRWARELDEDGDFDVCELDSETGVEEITPVRECITEI